LTSIIFFLILAQALTRHTYLSMNPKTLISSLLSEFDM